MVTGPKPGSVGYPKCGNILANVKSKVKVNEEWITSLNEKYDVKL
jgi:hypothetical protein